MTIEERKNTILAKISEMQSSVIDEERITALEENYEILTQCILEMSEIVYA